ncbi:MAG: 2-deoxy-5-keto-D-gluconate 6-phosphate aldolase domain-containing protein, partial [Pirellulales bacterium]
STIKGSEANMTIGTMTLGFDKPLYFLPFDHRASMQTKMFGWQGVLNAAQTAEIAAAKRVIYDGFLAAISASAPTENAAILVDEQFGAAILRDAAKQGYMTACPVEKSGEKELVFEYGEDFRRHVEAINPTFCKVLVRYNPEADNELKARQAARLKQLSDYLHGSHHRSFFLIELHVDAEPAQMERFHGQKKTYELDLRPSLIVQTLHELQGAGVQPDIWKVEGLDRREDAVNVVAAARRDGRDKVGCIILGGGADEQRVQVWLTAAASVPGFIGFAVGRSTFWDPLIEWRAKRSTREAAVAEIARRYREWVDIFEKARPSPGD